MDEDYGKGDEYVPDVEWIEQEIELAMSLLYILLMQVYMV